MNQLGQHMLSGYKNYFKEEFIMPTAVPASIITIVSIIVLLCIIALIITKCYVKAPPNEAYIISGWSKEPRVLRGKGGIKIPFLERIDKLYLGQMSVDIKTGRSVSSSRN